MLALPTYPSAGGRWGGADTMTENRSFVAVLEDVLAPSQIDRLRLETAPIGVPRARALRTPHRGVPSELDRRGRGCAGRNQPHRNVRLSARLKGSGRSRADGRRVRSWNSDRADAEGAAGGPAFPVAGRGRAGQHRRRAEQRAAPLAYITAPVLDKRALAPIPAVVVRLPRNAGRKGRPGQCTVANGFRTARVQLGPAVPARHRSHMPDNRIRKRRTHEPALDSTFALIERKTRRRPAMPLSA